MILFSFGRNAERRYTHFAPAARCEEEIRRRSAVYLGNNENVCPVRAALRPTRSFGTNQLSPGSRRLIHLKGSVRVRESPRTTCTGRAGGASCLPLPLKTTPACCISPPVVVPRLTTSVIVDVGKGADGAKPSRLRAARGPKQDSVTRRRAVKRWERRTGGVCAMGSQWVGPSANNLISTALAWLARQRLEYVPEPLRPRSSGYAEQRGPFLAQMICFGGLLGPIQMTDSAPSTHLLPL
ncbi:hypothetical protein CH63R_01845 [Colletotrichum higginsianum IMI 349063]|uniref:Uncharacterized protein n=1 Tax=Colletotrichum higginsianum (strain IMI 349063) TaxID=759273 RepID=A0A1B7YM67_COLHI|nr:hypothetical protein CH63R_01845 [Colletotrichum higginsianum IMI 349063]OBR13119.1 hypothetical protein CH63R_01845 [Colletotrichum higginsianum IMI 349063]